MPTRLFRTFAFLAAALFVASAAAQTLTFWTWRVEDRQAYEEIFSVYEAENPGVEIDFQAFEASTYNTVLSSALAADEGPDVMHVRAYGNFETFAEPGYLLPLDDQVPALANFPQLALQGETLRSDGRVYAVPFATQTLVIYYNTEIFAEVGVEVPHTWEEFQAVAQQLEDAGYIPLANGTATAWMDEILFGVFGPSVYGEGLFEDVTSGDATFEDPRFVAALERLNDLTAFMPEDFVGVDYAASQSLFLNGIAAMFAGGSWEIANFRNQNPDLPMDLMAPPASADGAQLVSSFLDGGYAVNANTNQQDAAVDFVNFLASEEFGQMLTDKLANVSPIPGVAPTDPLLEKVVAFNQNSVPYIMLVGFRYENPTGSTLLQEGLQQMFAGDVTAEEVGANLTEGIATYYEPFQGQ